MAVSNTRIQKETQRLLAEPGKQCSVSYLIRKKFPAYSYRYNRPNR
jgi:hypothetical protein